MKHAIFSPSAMHRIIPCPGSVKMSEGIESPSSWYSDQGTATHLVLDECITKQFKPKNFEGYEIVVDEEGDAHWKGRMAAPYQGREFVVDDEMVEAVQATLDELQSIVLGFFEEGANSVQQTGSRKLSIENLTGEEGATGTADVTITAEFDNGTKIYVGDFKYGMGVEVHSEENEQTVMYGLAAVEEAELYSNVVELSVGIHQPRLPGATKRWVVPEEWAADFRVKVRTAVTIALNVPKGEELYPDEDACRFCPAKATCPALYAEVSQHFGDKALLPATAIPLGAKMGAVELVEQWCKAVRAEVERQLLDGQEVEGWKLVQGKRGNRQWKDEAEAEKMLKGMRLKSALKLEEDPIYKRTLLGPAPIEKLLSKASPKRWRKLVDLITQAEGKPSVAPWEDPRPALSLVMEGEFEVVDDADDLI